MSERGVFAVDRGIWEHDLLADDQPFSRREAWLWLLSEAAWKPHRRRIVGRMFELERAQLVASLRFIAGKWRWSEARVRRFLSALKTDAMIDAKSDAGVTVITICKYDEYQRVSLPSDAKSDAETGARATQERRKVEDKEYKEDRKEDLNGTVAVATRPSDAFEDFWKVYPKRDGANPKAPAKAKFIAAVKSGVEAPMIIAAASRYASETRTKGQFGTPYVAQAKTWLSQQRYGDYQPQGPPGGQPTSIPKGAPTDEELRKRYGRPNPNPAVHTETEAGGEPRGRADHIKELQPESFGFLPGLRSF